MEFHYSPPSATAIHFRLFDNKAKLTSVCDWLTKEGLEHVASYEVGSSERPHMHSRVVLTKTLSTFRQRFNKMFPGYTGNKDYSMKVEKDYESNIKYILKGTENSPIPDVLSHFNTPEEVIEKYSGKWEFREEKEGSNPTRKTASETFVGYCARTFESPIFSAKIHGEDYFLRTKYYVYEHVMRCLGEKVKTLDTLIINRLINGVLNILLPAQTQRHFVNKIFDHDELRLLEGDGIISLHQS